MTLTPRQRVLAAINHEEPDRIPLIIGTSNTTSIKMETYQRLKAHLGLPPGNEKYIYDWPELGTALPDETARCSRGTPAACSTAFPKPSTRTQPHPAQPLHRRLGQRPERD